MNLYGNLLLKEVYVIMLFIRAHICAAWEWALHSVFSWGGEGGRGEGLGAVEMGQRMRMLNRKMFTLQV